MTIPMEHFLAVSSIMFFAGVYGFVARKNLFTVLISIELMLNSVEINFCVFNRYLYPEQMEGMFFTLFGIAITAAEAAVALAIIINVYRNSQDVDIRHIDKLHD